MPTSRRPHPLLLTEMAEANRSDLMTRRRRGPATEQPDIERDLVGLVADPLYWQDRDEDYFQYVKAQFDRVYGDGPVARDASGRQRQPQPKRPFATGLADCP